MFKVFIFNGYGFIAETRVLADYAGVRAFFWARADFWGTGGGE
jgi:hypothetical protein